MKRNLFKKLALVLAVMTVGSSLYGCSGALSKKDVILIGVNQFAPHPSLDNCYNGFAEGLKESGYVDGENIKIDLQNAQADMSKANTISNSFVAQKYNLICGIATPSAQTAFNNAQDTDIPVVFSAVTDPVSAGIVVSLDKPEHNVTGTSDLLPVELQMELMRTFLPSAHKVGVVYTLSEVNSTVQLKMLEDIAPTYGFEIISKGINDAKDIPIAVDALIADGAECFANLLDNTVVTSLSTVLEKTNAKKIPVFGSEPEQLRAGCLASQGIDYFKLGEQTGKMAARILKGEKASDIPVEYAAESQAYVNFAACAALGIPVPAEFANATAMDANTPTATPQEKTE